MKKAYRLNIITFTIILFSTLWMFSGLHFGKAPVALSGSRLGMFKFYTVDSNVIMGLIALFTAIMQKKVIDGKVADLSPWIYVLKLVGVVGVTLTMLVTVFFLSFTLGPYACFNNSNLFLHVINPVLSIVCFTCYEKTNLMTFKHSILGISSMVMYAVYYVIVSVMHSTGNVVDKGYDWYGFFALGLKSGFFVVPLIMLITYGISFVLWKLNKLK